MSYSWDGRPSPYGAPAYGGSGDLDISRVFNDPRFAETVQASVRQVATMSGAFAHSSIDPRAIAPVPTLDTFPPRRSVYPGMVIRYRFAHDGIARQMWWDEAANSGAGAWIAAGAPLYNSVLALQNVATDTVTALTDSAITVPCPGDYLCVGHAEMLIDTAGGVARAGAGTSALLPDADTGWADDALVVGSGSGARLLSVTAADLTVRIYGWSDNPAHTASFRRRRLIVTPIELRPY